MATFDTTTATIGSTTQAAGLLGNVRALYGQAKQMESLLALYNAGTDAKYNAAVNNIYTSAERSELAQMQSTVNALIADWEQNHRGALGLAPL